MTSDLAERDALAAKIFPHEWARASSQTGRKASSERRRLRKAAAAEVIMAPLREAGARCGTCHAFGTHGGIKNACSTHSDWDGYETRKPDDLCEYWRAR